MCVYPKSLPLPGQTPEIFHFPLHPTFPSVPSPDLTPSPFSLFLKYSLIFAFVLVLKKVKISIMKFEKKKKKNRLDLGDMGHTLQTPTLLDFL